MSASTQLTASAFVPGAVGNILYILNRNGHNVDRVDDVADVISHISIDIDCFKMRITPDEETFVFCSVLLIVADQLGVTFPTDHHRVKEVLRLIFRAFVLKDAARNTNTPFRILRALLQPGGKVTVVFNQPRAPSATASNSATMNTG